MNGVTHLKLLNQKGRKITEQHHLTMRTSQSASLTAPMEGIAGNLRSHKIAGQRCLLPPSPREMSQSDGAS
ncbi:MAG: hypothetical protein ATN31_04760 [Candidatus Epulonipiscioides saccharophilum]|nr:MAG: hypothetical protein ATN31_04760 [Epulopiscium sp. AS2M-Bin001]